MSKLGDIGARLYRGDVSIDFVGRRKTWYLASLAIVVIALGGLLFRGLNYGIEFRGGVEFNAQIASPAANVEKVTNAVTGTGISEAQTPTVVSSGTSAIRVQTKTLSLDQSAVVEKAIRSAGASEVNSTTIGPTWGASIAHRALTGLIVFVVLVVLFIWAYFREWRMSVAAIVALAHDLIITVGVYALTGFEVTPATVTGFLTILGYSLYDTVVVFDKVRENSRGVITSTRRTYAESANLAVNQTLVRSINTSLAALLPVGAILYVGTFQLGSGPLKDLALALFVGMAAGAYSSIFIATPLLAHMKSAEAENRLLERRLASRRRHEADRYASVPVFTEDLPARDADDDDSLDELDEGHSGHEVGAGSSQVPPRPVPTGRGRVVPQARAPLGQSNTAGRAQPTRQPRSKRGKK
ncbi:MAG: preprotein translocase subunit SecF [Pseudonocardiales bacterium]|nr:preprotein translocase subunit SecF [Pseudonocardiales bacterium]